MYPRGTFQRKSGGWDGTTFHTSTEGRGGREGASEGAAAGGTQGEFVD